MSDLKKFMEESKLIDEIKEYLFTTEGYDSWNEFVDNQTIGQCQSIVADIIRKYPKVQKVFGEIEVDESYFDEDEEEQTLMTHHWVSIGNKEYDFSKGTLKNYIDFSDIYDVEIEDSSIYHGF